MTTQKKKKKRVPMLRFEGFEGEWLTSPLKKVTSYVDYRGRAPKKSEKGHFLVTAKNIKKGFIDYKCSQEFVDEEDYPTVMSKGLPKLGDVLFTTEAPMGNVAQVNVDGIALAQRVIKFRGKKELENSYLLHYMLSNVFQKTITRKAIGTTVQGISGKELHKTKISFPSLEEQQKIALFFTTIDTRIQLLEKKKTLLKQYKKGVMQQIFKQEIRFKRDDGEEFGEWEKKSVSEMFRVTRGNVLSMTKVSDFNEGEYMYPVYSSQTKNGGLSGFYNEYLYENALTWTTDGANAGDVNYRTGKFYCTNVCGVLLSDEGYANTFIAEKLNSITRKYVSYVGNPKLMNGVMSEIVIEVPSIPEQTKIAHFLSSLDTKIAVIEQQIVGMKEWKKGLLQRMFV